MQAKRNTGLRVFMLVSMLFSLLAAGGPSAAFAASDSSAAAACRPIIYMGPTQYHGRSLNVPHSQRCASGAPYSHSPAAGAVAGAVADGSGAANPSAAGILSNSPSTLTGTDITILNNSGSGIAGANVNTSHGFTPPDTQGAAGPDVYVETVNDLVSIYNPKSTTGAPVSASFQHFFFTVGGITPIDPNFGCLCDAFSAYDDQIGRFVVGEIDVNFYNYDTNIDFAVSKTSSPTTLTTADWTFYSFFSNEPGLLADYPGDIGFNHDALVMTFNMFPFFGGNYHTEIMAFSQADLSNGVPSASLQVTRTDFNGFNVRPASMHDAAAGDPMWLVTETGGINGPDGQHIDVVKMANALTTPVFTTTTLPVAGYNDVAYPLNPDGRVIVDNIDTRIMKSAVQNGILVAAHHVGINFSENDAQWYAFNLSSGTPSLQNQGRVGYGANTYVSYPSLDINPAGQIGMTYIKSGTDTASDFSSMYITGRNPADPAGSMLPGVLVPAGAGQGNLNGDLRQGDMSQVNVDPVDHTFWAANEYAGPFVNYNTMNWSTAIANFSFPNADYALAATPTSLTLPLKSSLTTTIQSSVLAVGPIPLSLSAVINPPDALPYAGLTASLSPTAINSDGSATLTMSVGDSSTVPAVPNETYTVVVTAAGSPSHAVNVPVTIVDNTKPTLTLPGNLTVNATSPAGAVVTYSVGYADADNPNTQLSLACSPASGSSFANGTTTVSCSVTDPYGNATSGSFSVTVKNAAAQTQSLIALVKSMNLSSSLTNNLLAKLNDILTAIKAGNSSLANSELLDFIGFVQTKTGKGITAAQANQLITAAKQIKAAIGY